MSSKVFPAGSTIMKLRWDFAIELGILELREPVDQQLFDELCAKDPTYRAMGGLEAYNRIRDGFARPALPRFLLVYGAVPPRDTDVTKWVWSGREHEHFQTHDQGLWGDMLARICAAHGFRPGSYPSIYPPRVENSVDKWRLPDFALVHDTEEGRAALLDWDTAVRYLAFNTKPRTNRGSA
jgi:hypothetical protein